VHIKFDPKVLRLANIRQGTLLTGDGQKVNFSENTLNDTGEAAHCSQPAAWLGRCKRIGSPGHFHIPGGRPWNHHSGHP